MEKSTIIVYSSIGEYQNAIEDSEILKMVKERDKRDNGQRYGLEDVQRMIGAQDFPELDQ